MKRRYKDRRTRGIARVKPSEIYDGYDVCSLRVRIKGRRGGSRIMDKILRDADRQGIALNLVIVPSGPMNETQLRDWYQRLGFESFGSLWMRRLPRQTRRPARNRSAVRNRKGR